MDISEQLQNLKIEDSDVKIETDFVIFEAIQNLREKLSKCLGNKQPTREQEEIVKRKLINFFTDEINRTYHILWQGDDKQEEKDRKDEEEYNKQWNNDNDSDE